MSTIFAIRKDIPKYQILDLDVLDVTRNLPDDIDLDSVFDFSQLNTPLAQWWETPETRFVGVDNPGSEIPDISCWVDASLVLSPKAYRLLKDSLAAIGEFLPVNVDNQLHYIFNCFQLADEDDEKSKFNIEEGLASGLKHLEFREDSSNLLLFKSKAENCLTLFCNQRFKEIVNSFALGGVIFDEQLIIA